jgi:6-phosphogluconolactonase
MICCHHKCLPDHNDCTAEQPARHIAFLVYGKAKSEAVHHVLEDEFDAEQYPAQLIHPEQGDVQWYVDEATASGLKIK